MSNHLGMMFSGAGEDDEDNDTSGRTWCASCRMSGWWFNDCSDGPRNVRADLNGPYGRFTGERNEKGIRVCYDEDIVWAAWKGEFETMKATEMKLKPYNK